VVVKTSLLPSWTLTVTGYGQSKPVEQMVMIVMALLLIPMTIAMLQVFFQKVQPLALLH